MNWILENKEWIFSGIGVAIIGYLIKLFMKKRSSKKQINKNNSKNTNKIKINIGAGGKNSKDTVSTDSLILNKENIQVLFIDDERFKTVDNLKNAGWINTKTIKDVTNLDCIDVKNANVIFVDINGVGEKLFPTDKGLGLAEALKKKYPSKYIVIYSAQEQGDRFHKALRKVDYILSKNAEPYEFINILENCIK